MFHFSALLGCKGCVSDTYKACFPKGKWLPINEMLQLTPCKFGFSLYPLRGVITQAFASGKPF